MCNIGHFSYILILQVNFTLLMLLIHLLDVLRGFSFIVKDLFLLFICVFHFFGAPKTLCFSLWLINLLIGKKSLLVR